MSGKTKAERLDEMKRLYIQRAYSDIELAEKLGVSRETIFRDRRELATGDNSYYFEQDEQGRYHIPKSRLISEIKLNLHEALTLYLAGRKTSRQTRFHQPHTVNAVEKLAATLRQPMTERLLKSADRLLKQEKNPDKIKIVEMVAQAWVEQRKVRIEYQALGSDGLTRHANSPYLIEPSIWSDSVYVIARSDFNDKIFAFKMERILSAFLSGETFEIPESFDDEQLLKHAWGIWYADRDPVTVKLRFNSSAARRVMESIWHPLETVTDTEDGGCLWSAEVAEWREMLPWVRGWGADCEVLEPESLRKSLMREAQYLAELYKVVEMTAKYYAHSRKGEDKSNWQTLRVHLTNTADLAAKFGADAGVSELAKVAALMHDLGKYSKAFQKRLEGAGRKVDHATAGARTMMEIFNKTEVDKLLATMLAYCIAGHHTGLPDYGSSTDVDGDGTLLARLDPAKKKLEDFGAYKTEFDPATLNLKPRALKAEKKDRSFSHAFMTRMIYSALVDADFQETETFIQGEKERGGHANIEELCETFNIAMQKFDNPQGAINQKRTETLNACKEGAELEQGFFTLTIPTGGGKTLASMSFALNHAKRHGLKRVIYVIPFTSIIEQNAGVFKEYLGAENILEHHSNFDWKKGRKETEEADDQTKDALDKLKLASENWDIPIVVTTNVQFFESLFANKSSRCRKLHNMAKSVIIFDEAQMLPREFLDPCMLAVKELVTNYGASAVFCTATQPALNQRLPNETFTELAPDPQALFDFYKRVQVTNLGRTPDADLLAKIKEHTQALCIVNTRRHAKGLFDELKDDEGSYHLSTLMCPTHRKQVLEEVRTRLKEKQPCRVISTQVMEAGIDVDFPVGFRALAGLDSIIQAAGRVNREMKNGISDMFVFNPETEFIKKTPGFIQQGAAVAESVLRDYASQPDSKQAIEYYFNFLYNLQGKGAFDAKNILGHFDNGLEFEFKTAAENFRMIENNTVGVIIPYDKEAKKLLEQARQTPFPYKYARQLQMYTVNVYENEFIKLQSKGVIETINDTYEALSEGKMTEFYSEKTGLVLPADAGGDALFYDG